jgi:tRNA modification GTPase
MPKLTKGGLKTLYEGWRNDLVKCCALTEAIIDFGEDEGIEFELYEDGIFRAILS